MGIAIVHSRAMVGLEPVPVSVEVHAGTGLPRVAVVGLPEAAVRESKDRVRSAILASDLPFPDGRVTINLAPAELPKEGGRFDLAIALGVLAAQFTGALPRLDTTEVLGELSLNGSVRPVLGALPCAMACHAARRTLMLPLEGAEEAARVRDARLHFVGSLLEAWSYLRGRPVTVHAPPPLPPAPAETSSRDLADVRGQPSAKRALEIAAAGAHHLLMVGPPGTGKTMLAERLPTILPPLSEQEALETATVYSVRQGRTRDRRWYARPVRAPHHTTSTAGLIGGGSHPRPGEISLAHHGVLFLDELGEFPRTVLEALREPLESGRIVVARAAAHVEYPARFQLIAAMNPCPCGYFGDDTSRCSCTLDAVRKYQARVSGPLIDRIDIHVELRRPEHRRAAARSPPRPRGDPDPRPCEDGVPGEGSAEVLARIVAARERQRARCGTLNRDLDERDLRRTCALEPEPLRTLETAVDRLGISERGAGRIRRVARTIADLAGAPEIALAHLSEAINLRRFDRRG